MTSQVHLSFLQQPFPSRRNLLQGIVQNAVRRTLPQSANDLTPPIRLYLFTGETGIGRSYLLNQAAHALEHRLQLIALDCAHHQDETLLTRLNGLISEHHSPQSSFSEGTSSKDLCYAYLRHSSISTVALILDNIHLAGSDVLELITLLVGSPFAVAPLVLASCPTDRSSTYVDSLIALATSRGDCHIQALQRVTMSELDLHLGTLHPSSIPLPAATTLYERTQGLPLLLQAGLADLLANPKSELASSSPPLTVSEYADHKLSQVPPHSLTLLTLLAVSEVPLSCASLAVITGRSVSSVTTDLNQLAEICVLRTLHTAGDVSYAFSSSSIRDLTLTHIEPERRRVLHKRLGRHYESLSLSGGTELTELAAHHYLEALDTANGPKYAFLAADLAQKRFAPHAAISFLKRGTDLLAVESVDDRLEGLRKTVSLLALVGQLPAAIQCCNEMLLLCRTTSRHAEESHIINEMAQLYLELGDLVRGVEYAKVGYACERQVHSSEPARALLLQAQGLRRMGLLVDAGGRADQALNAAQLAEDTRSISIIKNIQGLISNDLGRHQEALSLFREAVSLKTVINDRDGIAMSSNNIGLVHLELGQLALASACFERGRTLARERAYSLLALLSTINLAEIARLQGHLEACIKLCYEALALTETSSRNQFLPVVLLNLSFARYYRGEYQAALESLDRALASSSASKIHVDLCLLHAAKAKVLFEMGLERDSIQAMSAASDIAVRLQCPSAAAPMLDTYGECGYLSHDGTLLSRYHTLANKHSEECSGEAPTSALFMNAYAASHSHRPSEVCDYVDRIIKASTKHGRIPDIVKAHSLLSYAFEEAKKYDRSRESLQTCLRLATANGFLGLVPRYAYRLARLHSAVGDWSGQQEAIRIGRDVAEQIGEKISADTLRRSFFATTQIRYLCAEHSVIRDDRLSSDTPVNTVTERATRSQGESAFYKNSAVPAGMSDICGTSIRISALRNMLDSVTKADCNVLLVGESGTGKELVARSIHAAGPRRRGPFVPVDCGALPENLVESELFGYRKGAFTGADSDRKGLLEEADNGILFLDEITNTSLSFQAKLLRTLQSGEFRRLGDNVLRRVDARIIAATNSDMDAAIRDGRFREDLFYRLNVVTLKLPPLRERDGDVPLLAEYFARHLCDARGIPFRGITRGAMHRLQSYAWPGNVRELEHAIHSALIVSIDGVIRQEALPERVQGTGDLEVDDSLEPVTFQWGSGEATAASAVINSRVAEPDPDPDERHLVEDALRRAGGDKSAAARLLGWNRMRLYRSLRRHGIPYDTGRQ